MVSRGTQALAIRARLIECRGCCCWCFTLVAVLLRDRESEVEVELSKLRTNAKQRHPLSTVFRVFLTAQAEL